MAKHTDKTPEEWDAIVEQWHEDSSIHIPLTQYMGLDDAK